MAEDAGLYQKGQQLQKAASQPSPSMPKSNFQMICHDSLGGKDKTVGSLSVKAMNEIRSICESAVASADKQIQSNMKRASDLEALLNGQTSKVSQSTRDEIRDYLASLASAASKPEPPPRSLQQAPDVGNPPKFSGTRGNKLASIPMKVKGKEIKLNVYYDGNIQKVQFDAVRAGVGYEKSFKGGEKLESNISAEANLKNRGDASVQIYFKIDF